MAKDESEQLSISYIMKGLEGTGFHSEANEKSLKLLSKGHID